MQLIRTPGIFELVMLLFFIILYGGYWLRMHFVGKQVNSSSARVGLKMVLRAVYFLLILTAFLGPSFGEMKKEVKAIGKDIYFLVDLSASMDAFDIQPSRIEKIKYELKNIVEAFNSDRIGLIIFSTDAFMQCPLTYDSKALMLFIETMNTNLISSSGTDFYPALSMAMDKFDKEDENLTNRQQSKVVILVSDGEDFGEETVAIANKVKDAGIKLFTLGVGTEKGSKIPQGYRFKRDKQGNDVTSVLNSQSLKELSRITGGKYFELSDKSNDVERLINSIDQIEGEMRDSRKVDVKANKYYYFLLAAFVLMLFDVLITVKTVKV